MAAGLGALSAVLSVLVLTAPTLAQDHRPRDGCGIPIDCPCPGFLDCVGGKCVKQATGQCEFFNSANDMGDSGGCADKYHEETRWREYCDVIGGRQARQCNDASIQPGHCGGDAVFTGYVFCDGQLQRDGSSAFCTPDSVGSAEFTPHGVGAIYRRWDGIAGASLAEMMADEHFLDSNGAPDAEEIYNDFFEAPTDVCDNCASELVGYFKAPADGAYTFWIGSDNQGEIWFSPGGGEADGSVIANVPGWSSARQYDKYPEQRSPPQQLAAGSYSFMRAIANEAGGGDNLSVAVTLPDGTLLAPIPMQTENDDGTVTTYMYFSREQQEQFAGQVPRDNGQDDVATPGAFYKMWAGVEGTSIDDLLADPDFLEHRDEPSESSILAEFFEAPSNVCDLCATEISGFFLPPDSGDYTFKISADDNGALYFGESESSGEVIATCPGWSSSRQYDKYPEQISDPITLQGETFYYIKALVNEGGGGDHVDVGMILPDGTDVSPIPIVPYIYLGTNQDIGAVLPGSLEPCGGAPDCSPRGRYRRWDNIDGTSIDQMLNDEEFLDDGGAPDEQQTVTEFFEAPTDVCDQCASELVGWFKAPTSGPYVFTIASDDNGHLYFGETEDRAERIALVEGWTSSRQWNKYPGQVSNPMQLVADNFYFIKAISNDGGGGDNVAVAVRLPDGTALEPIPISLDGVDYIYASLGDAPPPPAAMAGSTDCPNCTPGLTFRRWDNMPGTSREQMQANPAYLDSLDRGPDAAEVYTDSMEVPVNDCDRCDREVTA